MKVINSSYEIIEDKLARLSIPERIERCGRICYKSEDKIGPDTADPFVQKVIALGHNSVLEMAVLHFSVKCSLKEYLCLRSLKTQYLISSWDPINGTAYVTASIRSLRDAAWIQLGAPIFRDILVKVSDMYEYVFSGLIVAQTTAGKNDTVSIIPVKDIPKRFRKLHEHVAVCFVVNRAVSHELVRHRPCSFLQESQRYCRYDDDITFIEPRALMELGLNASYLNWVGAMQSTELAYKSILAAGGSPQAARTVLPNSCKTELIVYCDLAQWGHILNLRTSPGADPSMREVMIPLKAEMTEKYLGNWA